MSSKFSPRLIETPDKRHLRAGVWELPEGVTPRATVVILQGLTEYLEKYQEVADELRARGFTVVGLDWRSQGASERRRGGSNQGHVADFAEYDTDLAMVLNRVAMPLGAPVIALAHSMGAHILLRTLHGSPRRVLCACLVAPMLELETQGHKPWAVALATFLFNLNPRKPSTRFVFGVEEADPRDIPFEDNHVTSDRTRYERNRKLLKEKPFLRIHGPTFGWLAAALRSMRAMRRRGYAEDITTPLLIFGAGRDSIVKTAAIRAFAQGLPNARYVEIPEAEHEILMENDAIRARFWAEFDAFVEEQLAKGGLFGSTAAAAQS